MATAPTPFQHFVKKRIEEMARSQDNNEREAAKQGVSIRLDSGTIRGLDHMAKQLDLSRQSLLLELVTSGLQQVIAAWSHSYGDEYQRIQREIADLMSAKAEDL